jgi:hypothetical protein
MVRFLGVLAMLVALLVGSATAASADFDAGIRAYNAGDYATALREFKPLADRRRNLWACERQGAIADGQQERIDKTPRFQIDQQLSPAKGAFPVAGGKAKQFFSALRRGAADDHQHALALILHAGLKIDPVGPDIDIAPGRKVKKPLGRPPVGADTEDKVRALRAKDWGVNRIAKELGIGSGTVRRIAYN